MCRYFAAKRRQSRPRTAGNPYLVTVDGKPIANSLSAGTNILISEPSSRQDLSVQLAAKREAYDIIRSIRFQRPAEKQRNYLELHPGTGLAPLKIPTLDTYAEESSLELSQGPSSLDYSRHSSNLPTGRRHRGRSALRKCQSLDALLGRPSEEVQVVKLTSHAAVLSSASPIASARPLSAYQALHNSRPSTANAAIGNGGGGWGTGGVGSGTMRSSGGLGRSASVKVIVSPVTPSSAALKSAPTLKNVGVNLRSPKMTLAFGK